MYYDLMCRVYTLWLRESPQDHMEEYVSWLNLLVALLALLIAAGQLYQGCYPVRKLVQEQKLNPKKKQHRCPNGNRCMEKCM